MSRARGNHGSASAYGFGSAAITARHHSGEKPTATSGEKTWPPPGRADGRRWGETDGR
jgi:hypothetical protein